MHETRAGVHVPTPGFILLVELHALQLPLKMKPGRREDLPSWFHFRPKKPSKASVVPGCEPNPLILIKPTGLGACTPPRLKS